LVDGMATPEVRAAAGKATQARANARALALAPIIAEIRASGIIKPGAIATVLTARGIPTARGHRFWTDSPVRKVLDRLSRPEPPLVP
jgi:hypothetical protein